MIKSFSIFPASFCRKRVGTLEEQVLGTAVGHSKLTHHVNFKTKKFASKLGHLSNYDVTITSIRR